MNKSMNAMNRSFREWTQAELLALPLAIRPTAGPFRCAEVVVVATAEPHESGYRVMDLVLADQDHAAIGRLAHGIDDLVWEPAADGCAHHIDCLPMSGFLHVWVNPDHHEIQIEPQGLSTVKARVVRLPQ